MAVTERMSDEEVLAHMQEGTSLNKLRQAFSSASAHIEQASMQSRPISPIEIRRMEFEAVADILALAGKLGVTATPEDGYPTAEGA